MQRGFYTLRKEFSRQKYLQLRIAVQWDSRPSRRTPQRHFPEKVEESFILCLLPGTEGKSTLDAAGHTNHNHIHQIYIFLKAGSSLGRPFFPKAQWAWLSYVEVPSRYSVRLRVCILLLQNEALAACSNLHVLPLTADFLAC